MSIHDLIIRRMREFDRVSYARTRGAGQHMRDLLIELGHEMVQELGEPLTDDDAHELEAIMKGEGVEGQQNSPEAVIPRATQHIVNLL